MTKKLTLNEFLDQNYPELVSALKDAELEYRKKCYCCNKDGIGKSTDYVQGICNWCCKEHRESITRSSARSEKVYKYLHLGVKEANCLAKIDIPDDWLPEGWR